MPYELFLALRYLYSRRRRRLARVTALAAILGIAFGVAALIVALALGNGFRDEMRDKILKGTAHLTLMRADGEMMSDWRTILRRVRAVKGVTDATATTYEGALLSGPRASAYAVLRGLDPESESAVAQIRRTLIAGTFEPLLREQPVEKEAALTSANDASTAEQQQEQRHAPGEEKSVERRAQKREDEKAPAVTSFDEVPEEAELPAVVIGSELAERAGLQPLDVAQIISGETTLTPLGLAPRYRRVRVAGIFRSGLYEYDAAWVYLSLATAASFAGQPGPAASVISIEVADIYAAGETGARVREAVGAEFTTVDWQEANRQLFTALALERRMGLVILALIILIAALNITTTLVLVVVERRADIAILSAMGARARSIMYVFIIEGACVGSIGALCGVVLGLILCMIGDRYKLVSLPADVYSLSSVPFHPQARDVLMAALLALLLSLLATIYPARAAARLRPAEALRDTN
jgi:lipoprotein-releasing system permease protein